MTYLPHTEEDRREMLAAIGVSRLEDLFQDVPEHLRFPKLDLLPAVSEMEIMQEMMALSEANADAAHNACFLGAGVYNQFIPSVVDYVISRGEFNTAYTPYQPEVSQGTLQWIFEYQSLIVNLTGMEVSNASHYDGATAMAEAVLMAVATGRGRRRKVLMSPGVHPQYRTVAHTYTQGMNLTFAGDDRWDVTLEQLAAQLDEDTACVCIQNPDFLGRVYSLARLNALADAAHRAGALFVVSADPISLGLYNPPGSYGADIVTGEGQPLGIPMDYGGPYLGFFATRQEYVRRMAGRLVGETVDQHDDRGFVLTLATREQHIRREKATSNICTNTGLMALAATVYLSCMGRCGLAKVAELCYHKAHYAAREIDKLNAYHVDHGLPFFREFMVHTPIPVDELNHHLLEDYSIIGGYDLGLEYPELENHMLLCCTEMNRHQDIDRLVQALAEIAEEHHD